MQEDIIDTLLRYGLFFGAVFQLVCIGAVIIMPDNKSDCFNVSKRQYNFIQSARKIHPRQKFIFFHRTLM